MVAGPAEAEPEFTPTFVGGGTGTLG